MYLCESDGAGGARLTHSHERQYAYVLQSLTLWREIAHDMFRLFYLAEGDMLARDNRYRLSNTGQGLQRVGECFGVYFFAFFLLSSSSSTPKNSRSRVPLSPSLPLLP